MLSLRSAVFGFSAFILSTGLLFPASINLNTGFAPWTGSGPNVAGTVAAVNLGTSPNGVWLPAPAGAQWISTQPNDGLLPPAVTALSGTYVFQLSFDSFGQAGSVNFSVAADNQVTVELLRDGILVGSAFVHPGNSLINSNTSPGCAFLPAGSNACTPNLAAGLVGPGQINFGAGGIGAMIIRATVVNSIPPDPSPIGFLLVGSAEVTTITPEPASLALTGVAGFAFLLTRRRRQ